MDRYVSIRTNWSSSIDLNSLERVCDVNIEENHQSTMMENDEESKLSRPAGSSDEPINSVILRANDSEKQEEAMIILTVCQPDAYSINSIQILSNAKHFEFYAEEYIGTCQGSRITELENNSIYECIFDVSPPRQELTIKFLKLADTNDLIIHCIQITLIEQKIDASSNPSRNLPFDINRVRSMVDETNLSKNARQFLNNLQQSEKQRQTTSQSFNLSQMMTMMQGMKTSSTSSLKSSNLIFTEEMKNKEHRSDEEFNAALETRLQRYIDQRFHQLEQHIDERFNRLEEKLTSLSHT